MRPTLPALALLPTILALIPAAYVFAAVDVGQPAPALVAQELNGQTFDLAAQRGKVVVINFWATWCPPCHKEMPALDAFYRKYHSQGLEMIGMSVDRPHDSNEVRRVMQSYSYPAAMSEDAKVNEFGSPDTVPLTFVVDSKGIVRAKLTPDETAVTEKTLAAAVLPLLAQRTATGLPSGNNRRPEGWSLTGRSVMMQACHSLGRRQWSLRMKEFAIAAALLAGCASINHGPDGSAKLKQIQERSQAIAAQERACEASVEKQTNDELAKIGATLNDFTESKMMSANEQKHRQLAKCTADAQRAADELFSKERAEYQSRAQEERDRSALMMILTTSRLH